MRAQINGKLTIMAANAITGKFMGGAPAKFTDKAQLKYLNALCETGRHVSAAMAAGCSASTAQRYRDANPSYDDDCTAAIEVYHAWIYNQIKLRIQDGSDRILELEAKRVDGSYRDKPLVDINLNAQVGGVIVAPAQKSPEQFMLELQARNIERTDPTED